jgi:hypothetical protein
MGEVAKRATLRAPREAGQYGSWEAHTFDRCQAQNRGGATGKVGAGQGPAGEKSSLEFWQRRRFPGGVASCDPTPFNLNFSLLPLRR